MKFNPTMNIDSYKLSHQKMYPEGTEYVYSNFTPRGSRIDGVDKVVFFGLQAWIDEFENLYREEFFNKDIDVICAEFEQNCMELLGLNNVGSDHWRALHKLGYLPLEFKAMPEGSEVPLKVPVFTVENTNPDFFWLVNYIESWVSVGVWIPTTSATKAKHFRSILEPWAIKTTGSTAGVEFQGHDFSFRGMGSIEESAAAGAGHLTSFVGSDTIQAKAWIKEHYDEASEPIMLTLPASEHSVMCAGGAGPDDEDATYERMLDIYPNGLLALVSDTWDLWRVLTETLPKLKDKIMARDGKLVIRPDSGDPVDILCGIHTPFTGLTLDPAEKGVVELLWDEFGGTVNAQGYKVLDSHVGAVYGDSITPERAEAICERLEAKGFASTNVVFGLGSFHYRYVTRDTFGFAMKATSVTVNGVEQAIFKDPITDSGEKRSARGRMIVVEEYDEEHDIAGELKMIDGLTREEQVEYSDYDYLQTVWRDGYWLYRQDFDQIRARVAAQ